ncbi:hypothetical protein EV356DRAFT_346525 [Viridothelium virens]|uniref:Uncharacterized protein n=1 Tax=Viridothelium virens TaxID=1048519 RepID=A0A6A6GWU9_VIRVR|nr:hypothetical protein EV356DRAFT_346525 [Viridothelium virens]
MTPVRSAATQPEHNPAAIDPSASGDLLPTNARGTSPNEGKVGPEVETDLPIGVESFVEALASEVNPSSTVPNLIANINDHPIFGDNSGAVVIDGLTFGEGSSATIDNVPVGVMPNSIFIGLPSSVGGGSRPAGTEVANVAGTPISVDPQGAVIIDGQRLKPGEETTIAKTPIAAEESAVIVGPLKIPIMTEEENPTAPKIAEIDSHPIIAGPSGAIIIGAQTLQPGATGTIGKIPVSIGSAGVYVAFGSGSSAGKGVAGPFLSALSTPNPAPTNEILTIGSQTITAAPVTGASGVYEVGSLFLTVNGRAATISGKVVSAVPDGIVIEGSTVRLSPMSAGVVVSELTQALGAFVPFGTNSVEAIETTGSGGAKEVLLAGSTLQVEGSPIFQNGEIISAGPSEIVVNREGKVMTIPLSAVSIPGDASVTEAIFDLGSSRITAVEQPNPSGGPPIIVMGSKTLTVGGTAMTIDGETISAGPSGLFILDRSKTDTVMFSTVPTSPAFLTATASSSDLSSTTSTRATYSASAIPFPSSPVKEGDAWRSFGYTFLLWYLLVTWLSVLFHLL